MLQKLSHYYVTRGKAEIASFLQTWVAGFSGIFALLALFQFEGLLRPDVTSDTVSLFASFVLALGRSILGGLIYAVVPEPIRQKLRDILLRAGKKDS